MPSRDLYKNVWYNKGMNREQQDQINQKAIHAVAAMMAGRPIAPRYRAVVAQLNAEGYRTSRGNDWTPHRLFRMLQRNGFSGLHGLLRNGHFRTR